MKITDIEEVAHNDDNPLPPFFTKAQLEELYVNYLLELQHA